MKRILLSLVILLAAGMAFGQLIINEIDYDQPSTDNYEFVELAGPAGTYTNVVLNLVNGNGGTSYLEISLGNITLSNETSGYGFYVIGVTDVANVDYSTGLASNWLQNGSPDGVQISVNGSIVDAVAYEGALNDLSGNPMESTDDGSNTYPESGPDSSFSRIGLDGSPWVVTTNTPGEVNTGQTLSADVNYPPIADAGPDQLVMVGALVTLDGSNSTDANDNIMSYAWAQTYGTAVAPTLTGANTAVATFTAPITPQDYSFELVVTDSVGEVSRDTVNIAVREQEESKLIISEYIEGDGGNNKAIELYNLDTNAISLSGYSVKLGSNGEGWGTEEVLSGTIDGNGVYVIANSSSIQSILDVADITSAVTYFNGNDAVGLFLNGFLVDVIGDPDNDPGTGWDVAGVTTATANHTLIRKPSVEYADANWSNSAGTNSDNSEWIVMDANYFSDLGSHTAGPVAYSFSNATVTTVFPQAGSEISIQVDITPGESVSAPSTVKVWYGFDGTQANSADMWLESGTTYAGVIPALSQGDNTLDYYIAATGGGETVNSGLYSMVVAGAVTDISDIHTNIATYNGQVKTIEGVITIGAGVLRDDRTSCYIQDESGRGLNLYNSSTVLSDLTRGTKVKLVGTVTLYYTTVEIEDFTYSVVSTGNDLPSTNYVTVSEANSDNHEGTLTSVSGTFSAVQEFATSKNIILTTGTDSAIVKVWPTTGIDPSSYTIGNEYTIMGVGSQYSGEYQLLVGYATDITPYTAICEDCTPTEFALDKAYPNPFNPTTTVQFSLTEASDYSITIYNIAGQRMGVLASGYAEPGVYKQVWNAADFTSGVYFLRLEAGMNVATQKVVLIK